tara:strand:- start:325 stop:456 length:132 start_codon:yes stop_codon:yes gene_type:complete
LKKYNKTIIITKIGNNTIIKNNEKIISKILFEILYNISILALK